MVRCPRVKQEDVNVFFNYQMEDLLPGCNRGIFPWKRVCFDWCTDTSERSRAQGMLKIDDSCSDSLLITLSYNSTPSSLEMRMVGTDYHVDRAFLKQTTLCAYTTDRPAWVEALLFMWLIPAQSETWYHERVAKYVSRKVARVTRLEILVVFGNHLSTPFRKHQGGLDTLREGPLKRAILLSVSLTGKERFIASVRYTEIRGS